MNVLTSIVSLGLSIAALASPAAKGGGGAQAPSAPTAVKGAMPGPNAPLPGAKAPLPAGKAAPPVARDAAAATRAVATFAGGCFWSEEATFEGLPGVVSVTSGYTGGTMKNPSYEDVSTGGTGHLESVEVVFDPRDISYARLLDLYWHNIDPTQTNGQFCDHGDEYRTAIFVHDETQRRLAEESKRALEASAHLPGPIVTEIVPAGPFYPAEGYHQDFWKKNSAHYHAYRFGCGRDRRLQELWGKPGREAPVK